MLKAWHLPVAPFIQVQQDRLFITLWLSGESLPQRITLRAEEDNEELSLPMQRLRQAPQPGVVAWRGEISLASGQPVYATRLHSIPAGQTGAVRH